MFRTRHRKSPALVLLALVPFFAVSRPVVHAAEVLPVGASQYVPVSPFRLADTRPLPAYGFTTIDAKTIRVNITGRAGVPANATAAVVNITMIGSAGPGFVTAYPSGVTRPTTSNLNADVANRLIANLAHVKIGVDGSIDIYRSVGANLAIDLVGVYVPVTQPVAGGRLVTIASGAKRVFDTRVRGYPVGPGLTTEVDLKDSGIPVNASAAVVSITAVGAASGFWTAFTAGTPLPVTSTLNIDTPGQTRPAQAIVMMNGTNKSISVYTARGGHLLVDVVGWFTGSTDAVSSNGLFVPTSPLRMLDTRTQRTLAPWGGSSYEFYIGNTIAQVSAVVMNITGNSPWNNGFVTAFPAGAARPGSSNLNFNAWPQTIANHAISRVSTRGAALYTSAGAHLIADVAGWYLGPPSVAALAVPANPNYYPNSTSRVVVNKIGVNVAVHAGGNLDYWADRGYSVTWSDIVNVASPGNVMAFGHRTTGSAPFRYLNLLKAGDTFSLVGADGHYYNYRVVHIGVTSPSYTAIANIAAYMKAPVTAQLVACSKPDGTPTSTSYRVVVTGRLVSVT